MSSPNHPQKVEVSHRTIIFTVLFLLCLLLLWQIRSIIILLFLCFILMEALNPSDSWLESKRIPRPLAILVLYIMIIAFFAFGVAGVVPILIDQTTSLINSLPQIISNTTFFGMPALDISNQFKILESLPANIAKLTISIFSNIFSTFIVFVITFYLLLERKHFDKYGTDLFGKDEKNKFNLLVDKLEKRLGSWVDAELFLMTIVGLLAYIGYLVLGLPFAVPLAIVAGLLEIIPNIGPTISTALAGLIGLTISPGTALLAVVWGIIVQQLENNVIVPKIMKETVGLNPLITIVLIATGAQLGGVAGAVLAIPIFLTAEILFKAFYRS